MKKTFSLLIICILCISIAGCGKQSTNIATYTGIIEGDVENIKYELTVNEDMTCEFNQYYLNQDDSYVLYHSVGTAEKTDNGFNLLYTIGEQSFTANIEIEGEIIKSAVSEYYDSNADFSDITGMYDCDTDESIILTIDSKGRAKLLMGETLYENTSIISYENELDLMVYGQDDELIMDWIVRLNDDGTFSYITYAEYVYAPFEGVYECEGALGNFSLYVYRDGTCAVNVEIEGIELDFTGTVTAYEDKLISAYLNSVEEDVLTLYFNTEESQGTTLYYTGQYTFAIK